MVKRYRVVVNGEVFEVEIEEMGGSFSPTVRSVREMGAAPASAPRVPAPAASVTSGEARMPAKKPAPAASAVPGSRGTSASLPPAASAVPGSSGFHAVSSPLPGKILRYAVSEGQPVKRGDVLMMIEAMKMENEIFAAESGVVRRIYPAVGQNVETGEKLMDIEVGG
jgi:glutaconyl-CoA decarboxylase